MPPKVGTETARNGFAIGTVAACPSVILSFCCWCQNDRMPKCHAKKRVSFGTYDARDKEHHDWGQDESEVKYPIQRLTELGQLVVDPFCGGGQIPAACKGLGRRWLATEINRNTALVARKRLAELSRSKKVA